ncbi:MAG: rRNA maturation RNase YbeY [Patescibacteria group bacterium]
MVEVNNLTSAVVDEEFLKKVARIVLKGENKIDLELSIALVGQERIKELNKQYRGKNKATDVLSFKYDNNFGEVVICPQETKELPRVLIHGILHILGFSHKKMNEDKYLRQICQTTAISPH